MTPNDPNADGPFTVLFYEPTHTGHHLPYLARMLPGFLRLGVRAVLATSPQAVESEEYAKSLARFGPDELEVLPVCGPGRRGSAAAYAWRRFQEARRIVRDVRPDHLCVMYAHGIWQLWALLRPLGVRLAPRGTTVEAWEYRGGFTYPTATGRGDRVKRRLLRSLLRSGQLDVLQCDDEYLQEFGAAVPGSRTQVKLTPNPIKLSDMIPRDEARRALGIPVEGTYFGCSGMMSRNKGSDLAVRAFARLLETTADATQHCRLLLAGPQSEDVRGLLAEPAYAPLVEAGRVVSVDRFLNEDEMFQAAAGSDVVLAPYPNHSGRSSVILWAAAAGRPSLAVNRGCIQRVVETERLGAVTPVRDIEAFADAMRRALADVWTDEDVRRVRAYAAWHRIENYQELSAEFVRGRLEAARR